MVVPHLCLLSCRFRQSFINSTLHMLLRSNGRISPRYSTSTWSSIETRPEPCCWMAQCCVGFHHPFGMWKTSAARRTRPSSLEPQGLKALCQIHEQMFRRFYTAWECRQDCNDIVEFEHGMFAVKSIILLSCTSDVKGLGDLSACCGKGAHAKCTFWVVRSATYRVRLPASEKYASS